MKIKNPFVRADVTVQKNGKITATLIVGYDSRIAEKDANDSFLLGSLKRLLQAEYVSIYPESKKEEEQ